MEDSKLQRLHDTLKKLAPKGNHVSCVLASPIYMNLFCVIVNSVRASYFLLGVIMSVAEVNS